MSRTPHLPFGDVPEPEPDGSGIEPWEAWAAYLGLGGQAVLTLDETAMLLKVSERHVRDQIKKGNIPVLRLGRRALVPVPKLLALLSVTDGA